MGNADQFRKAGSGRKGFLRVAAAVIVVLTSSLLPSGPVNFTATANAETGAPVDQISITLHSQSGGMTLGGDGTNLSTLDLNTLVAFGSIASGLTRSVAADRFTVSTTLGVKVALSSGTSQSYTLLASIDSSSSLMTWQLDGSQLTSSQNSFALNQPYNLIVAHTLAVTIPFDEPAGTFNRSIELVAISN